MRRLPNERLQRSARNRGSRDIQHRCARPLNLFVGSQSIAPVRTHTYFRNHIWHIPATMVCDRIGKLFPH